MKTLNLLATVAASLAALSLAACGDSAADARLNAEAAAHSRAEDAVRAALRDPDSAQFRAERIGFLAGAPFVCGEVNAANGFGGKAGFEQFIWKNDSVVFEGDGGAAFFARLHALLCER